MKNKKRHEKILISACLLGVRCRYDNKERPFREVIRLCKKENIIPVCPEQLGGLSTARFASGLETGRGEDVLNGNGRVINEKGEDVSKQFIRGAREVLKISKLLGAKKFIAKSKSPSCGLGATLKASFKKNKFSNKQVKGDGVAVAFLKRNGLNVITENDLMNFD